MKRFLQIIFKYVPLKKINNLILPGFIIDRKWKIEKHLGQGGGGYTYICTKIDDKNKKHFVIKVLNDNNGEIRKQRIIRFDNEIDTLKRITSPRVVKCINSYNKNSYLSSHDKRWYVMPKGESVKLLLDTHANKNNGIYDSDTLRVILKNTLFLFKTLKYLHNQNIYHRDIKPENLISIKNRAIFIDFGIAHDKSNATEITKKYDKNGLGPKFYMPPEMRRNSLTADYSKVDIYSLTKTLWACLTGEYKSFDGEYNRNHTNFLNYKRCQFLKQQLSVDLEHLHDFFEVNTANEPTSRMTIDEAIVKLDSFIFLCFNKTHLGRNFHLHGLEREKNFLFQLFIQRLDITQINTLDIDMNHISNDLLQYINIANSVKWAWDMFSIDKLRNVVFFNTYLENNSIIENILNVNLKISNNSNVNQASIIILIKTNKDTYIINEVI